MRVFSIGMPLTGMVHGSFDDGAAEAKVALVKERNRLTRGNGALGFIKMDVKAVIFYA